MGVILRQSLKATIVNYVGTFIGFLTTMFIVTEFLQPEEIGLTKLLLEVAILFSYLAQFGVPATAMRYFPYFKGGENNNGLFYYMTMTSLFGLGLFVLAFLALDYPINLMFSEKSAMFVEYKWWIVPLTICLIGMGLVESYANLLMRITVPRLIREVVVRLFLIVVYVLFAFQFYGITGLVAGTVIAYALCAVLGWLYLPSIGSVSLKHNNHFITPDLRRSIIRYMLFVVVGGIGAVLVSKLDIIMVGSQMGLSSAGIFTIAFYMAMVVEIPSRSISAISAPLASQAVRDGNFEEVKRLNKMVSLHQLLIAGVVFMFIWINIDNIFRIIPNGDVYDEGKWVVFFIGCAKLIEMIFGFSNKIVSYSKLYYWTFVFTVVISGITVLFNLLLIPVWGINGAALATFLTCIIVYTLNQLFIVRRLKATPLCWGMVRFLLLMGALLIVNLFMPVLQSPWLDAIYRSAVIGVIFLPGIYFLRISDDLNEKVDKYLLKKQ
ncbi:MAG: oligosaccharide flippase family protein [Marinifilaceae bacterium]